MHLHLSYRKKKKKKAIKRPFWEQRMYSHKKKNVTNKGQLKHLDLEVHFISKHISLVF